MKTMAEALGVSATTVSLALRDSPRITPALRARIRAYADEAGYVPDATASELTALMRSRRRSRSREVIAYINTFSDPALMGRVPTFMQFFEGARRRAEAFGYQLIPFNAREPGMTGRRLAGICKARGIRGLLLGPKFGLDAELEFDWAAFSVVLVGEAEFRAGLYRVCNHHVNSAYTVLDRLAARGYRRIGVALIDSDEFPRGHDYTLGIEQFRLERRNGVTLSTHSYDSSRPELLESWVRRDALDAVVSLNGDVWSGLERSRAEGGHLAYANLNVEADSGYSGIDQHSDMIGEAAFDLLRSLLAGGIRGPSPHSPVLLLKGSWVDGQTARALAQV